MNKQIAPPDPTDNTDDHIVRVSLKIEIDNSKPDALAKWAALAQLLKVWMGDDSAARMLAKLEEQLKARGESNGEMVTVEYRESL